MKAVIYARYSDDNQREESIEGQLRECYEYAKRHGIEVIAEYIDRAMTGRNDNRPDFQRMIKESDSNACKYSFSGSKRAKDYRGIKGERSAFMGAEDEPSQGKCRGSCAS